MIGRKFCPTFFSIRISITRMFRNLQLYYKYLGTVLGDFVIYSLQLDESFGYEMCVFAYREYVNQSNWFGGSGIIVKFNNKGVKIVGPSRPQGVFVEASSSTTINVTWSAPAEPNGIIQNYLIEYGKSPNHQPTEKVVTNRTFQFTLTGLEKFTTYYIKVRGKTSVRGDASGVLNATTIEDRKYCYLFIYSL